MAKKKRKTDKTNQTRLMALYAIIGCVILLMVACGLSFYTSQRPAPATPVIDVSQIPDYHDDQGLPYPDIPRISVAEAKAKFDAGAAIFVDVRSLEEYQARHIPGAVAMPIEEIPVRFSDFRNFPKRRRSSSIAPDRAKNPAPVRRKS